MANDRQFIVEVLDADKGQVVRYAVTGLQVTGSRITGASVGAAASLITAGGNGQSAIVGAAVTPPSAKVVDANGNAVAGSTVSWRIAAGNSATTSGNPTTTTNSLGIASIGGWSMGTTAGQVNILEAYSGALTNSPLSFQITPTAASMFSITMSGGTSQTTIPTGGLPSRLTALVHDMYGNPASNATINWTTSDPDGVITVSQTTTNTNGLSGITYQAGQVASTWSVYATLQSSTTSRTFTSITTSGAPTIINIVSGNNQVALSGTTLPTACTVSLDDGFGNPINSGVTVNFVIVAGSGRLSSATTTPVNSIASVEWQLGSTAASNKLEVSIANVSNSTVTFTASGTNPAADTIQYESGGTQTAVVATALTLPFAVATLGSGSSASGAVVDWSITSQPVGSGASLTVSLATSSTTGVARAVLSGGSYVGVYAVTASNAALTGSPVTFTATFTVDAAAKLAITQQPQSNPNAGAAWSPQPVVVSTDSWGNLVSTNTRVGAVLVSGSGTLDSAVSLFAVASGATATFSGLSYGNASGAFQVAFRCNSLSTVTATAQSAAPPFASKLAFTTQPSNVVVNTGFSPNVVVAIQDSTGATVTNATDPVTLAYANNAGGGTLGGTLTVNAVSGLATFTNLTNSVVGTGYTLAATSGVLTGATSAAYNVTAAPTSNKPTDVTMVQYVNGDMSSEALNTAFTNNSSHVGMQTGNTNSTNMRIRLLSEQNTGVAWMTSVAPESAIFGSCPNGKDRVLACVFGGSGQVVTPDEKGKLFKSPPATAKTIYGIWYGVVNDKWYGQVTGSFKKFYFRDATTQPAVFLYDGAGTAAINAKINYQSPNASLKSTIAGMARGTWALWEFVAVCPTTANGSDGHLTIFKNGQKSHQSANYRAGSTTWGESQFIHFFGGTGNTTFPAGNGPNVCLTGDGFEFWYSTSRAGLA